MENRRILITKQLLCESFISLLKQKPIDKISVTELCQAANVNRGSFYAHYADVYDLLFFLQLCIKMQSLLFRNEPEKVLKNKSYILKIRF